jgi:hypothetical protein
LKAAPTVAVPKAANPANTTPSTASLVIVGTFVPEQAAPPLVCPDTAVRRGGAGQRTAVSRQQQGQGCPQSCRGCTSLCPPAPAPPAPTPLPHSRGITRVLTVGSMNVFVTTGRAAAASGLLGSTWPAAAGAEGRGCCV